jgi:hypothetical protein
MKIAHSGPKLERAINPAINARETRKIKRVRVEIMVQS